MGPSIDWSDDDTFTVDGASFRSVPYVGTASSTGPEQLLVLKPRSEIESYQALLSELQPRAILELGIYKGGSTALVAQLAQPDKLVALDLREDCPPLERFIDARSLRGVVVPRYGIDQSDGPALDAIVAEEFDGTPLDLVIDDASHLLPQTVASFNRLFPYLRPGGSYLIEDWSWSHARILVPPTQYQGVAPLSAFICQLAIAAASRPAVVAGMTLDMQKAVVRRGPRDLDPARFDISAHLDPVGRAMVERLLQVRTPVAEPS